YLPLPLLAADVDAARHLSSTCNGVGAFFLGSLYKTGRKLSKGLVTALSCCGLTSSGIGRCSCCTSPNGRTKKARFLAPTEIVGAFLFSQTRPGKPVRSQKSRYADANLLWSGSASPPRKEEWGRKVKSPHCLHRQSDTPNDCCPRKRHVWGTGQSRWHPKRRRLCCL